MGEPLDSGARQSRSTSESSDSPCTGVPGTDGGPRTSTAIRPWTRRSAAESPATSLITTRNSAWPCTFEPVVMVTDEPDEEIRTSRSVSCWVLTTVGTGSLTPGERYGARSIVWDSPARRVAIRIGARDGGGVWITRIRMRPGSLPSAATRRVPVSPASVPAEAVTWTTPATGVPAVSPGADPSSKPADQSRLPTWSGSTVHTWHTAAMSMRTDSACDTSIGSSGQRRIGLVSPTCTGTDRVALMPSGSSTLVPVVTSKTTAPGPAYPSLAATRNEPFPVTDASSWAWGEAHIRLFRVKSTCPPDGFTT